MTIRLDEPARRTCKDHPRVPAIARCTSCRRALCDACYRFRLGDHPACARCAYEATTRPQRRIALAAAFLCFAWGGDVWLSRKYDLWTESPVLVVLGAALAAVIAYLIGASARSGPELALENRDPEEDAPPEEVLEPRGGSPYRAYARRAILAVSPRLSGKVTALVVGASLAATAVLLPVTLDLPHWMEAELVLGAWWLIVSATLVVLLHRGFRLRDDLVLFMPWNRPSVPEGESGSATKTTSKGTTVRDMAGCGDGCSVLDGELLGAALLLAVAFGGAWIFVELAMPIVFFVTYWLFMRAIGRVANDRHGCEGDAARSLGWGALWATIYVLPLAGLTWAYHVLRG